MATLIDVLNTLTASIAQVVYPNGIGQPSTAETPVKIYPGWPVGNILDTDLPQGVCHVSIYPRDEEQNTTRYTTDWQPGAINVPTLTATVNGNTITIGGTVSVQQNVSIVANNQAFGYGVQVTDTLTSIATALAAMIAVNIAGTTSTGAVITLPATAIIKAARIGTTGSISREVRRQKKQFQITLWCDTPEHRNALAEPIDSALSTAYFLTMPDGYGARLMYQKSRMTDQLEKARIYRLDMFYSVEFATTQTDTAYTVTLPQTGIGKVLGAEAPVSSIVITS